MGAGDVASVSRRPQGSSTAETTWRTVYECSKLSLVPFFFDSDGLIKLNRAGVLLQALGAFDSIRPEAVYREVVTEGQALRYADAEAIDEALSSAATVVAI